MLPSSRRAALERQHAGQDLQQGALAGPVRTDERHLLAALQDQVEAVVDGVRAVALDDPVEGDHHPAAARRLGEPELHRFGAGGGDLDPIDPCELLDAALDLARLRLLVAEALDEALDLGDLAALRLGRHLELRQALVALLDEVGEVADVLGEEAVVELRDAVDDGVDEVAVVADQHHRAGVFGQEPLQPFDRCQVEMVGRLVEQEHVGVLEEQPGERDAHHPAAAELAGLALHVALGKAEPGQDAPRLGLQRPAAELLEPMLQPPVLVHQLGQLVLGAGVSLASAISASMWRIRRSMPLTAPAPASTSATTLRPCAWATSWRR